ncbi:MAG TPA: hypothetical protein VF699_11110 [Caulobacteraceae bacterium]|jgi:hypothetical protein
MAQSEPVSTPFTVAVNGPVVVVTGEYGVAIGMSPEAVLESLEPLRAAAEEALANRENGIEPE